VFVKYDPGPCPVDDAPHTTCVAPHSGPITSVQFPMRDGVVTPPLVGAVLMPPLTGAVAQPVETSAPRLRAEQIQDTLPDGYVTTATYRIKHKRVN